MFKKTIIFTLFISVTLYCLCQNVRINPKINLKLGFSLNRVFDVGDKFYLFTKDKYKDGICSNEKFYLKPNLRIEGNYFITKWLEVGFYGGFFEYNAFNVTYEDSLAKIVSIKTFAPAFGLNCNFHFLKLLKNSKLKNLDMYYIFKFGGAILPRWGGEFEYPIYTFIGDPIYSKYRSSYCFGLGGTYTFWKKLGIYSELTFGKHSYFPDIDLKSHISLRSGIILSI